MPIRVGTNLEGANPALLHAILPQLDVVEIVPDALAVQPDGAPGAIPKEALQFLAEIARHAAIVVHGVGLSIGAASGWNDHYFRLLDPILEAVPVAWHSEHLGFTHVDGQFTGTMLSLPRSEEALELVMERTQAIMDRYPLPFLLENVVNLLPDPPAQMSEPTFLNRLTSATGCELLLDAYNLRCNAHNQGFCLETYLAELDLTRVREIHVAGGVERAGLMLDIHSRGTHGETRALLAELLPRAPHTAAVIYEIMPQAAPALGVQAWSQELAWLRALVAA